MTNDRPDELVHTTPRDGYDLVLELSRPSRG